MGVSSCFSPLLLLPLEVTRWSINSLRIRRAIYDGTHMPFTVSPFPSFRFASLPMGGGTAVQ